jgi:NitT/TauT family transport system permease protein
MQPLNDTSTTSKATVVALFAAALLLLWIVGSNSLPIYILPPPGEVFRGVVDFFLSARNRSHLLSTWVVIGSSIAISFTGGSILALVAYYFPFFEPLIHRRLSPFLNSFSGIGWTLLAVVWFGVSRETVIFSISVVLLPFALINLREGLKALDGELGEMARSFGRSRFRQLLLIVLPALFPFAAATLRIMFSVAWKVALTAELFGGNAGLGYLINLARQEFDTTTIFVVILFIIVAVYSVDRLVFLRMERATQRRFGGAQR